MGMYIITYVRIGYIYYAKWCFKAEAMKSSSASMKWMQTCWYTLHLSEKGEAGRIIKQVAAQSELFVQTGVHFESQ